MVFIPAGTFMMGSPKGEKNRKSNETLHEVTLTQPFLMASTPVTQAQYRAITGKSPSHFAGGARPVENVTWYEAVAFCNALSRSEGRSPAYRVSGVSVTILSGSTGYRLPTEAEWEYACRAGTRTRYWSGDGKADLARVGWYGGNETHPVTGKPPNHWGLYDMHGNVREWCQDWYGEYSSHRETDPGGPSGGSNRVVRGGCCFFPAWLARSAFRHSLEPRFRRHSVGFRLVLRPSP